MNIVGDLELVDALRPVADAEGLPTLTIWRVLRLIARLGLARRVADWLLAEEQRLSNERVRKEEAADEARRLHGR